MAARDAELAVLPEHRRVQRADSGARREASEAEARQALHAIAPAARSQAHASARVTAKLHDEILSQLPDDFIRRMMNWARTIDGTPVSVSKLEERVDHTRTDQPLPVLLGEADDTHAIVRGLPPKYQEAVTIFWTHQARPLSWMCQSTPRMRLWKVSPSWLTEWLERGHAMLISEIGRKR